MSLISYSVRFVIHLSINLKDKDLQELKKVVITAKLITEVVTAASATINAVAPQLTTTAAPTLTTAPSAARRRKGVVIRDPEETATPSTIIHSKAKSKDRGKWILEKEDNIVMRYQALKRKPQTKAQAKKNMMIYLRNVAGFKIDYFRGMSYDDIHPIFEKMFNSNIAFLENTKEQMKEEYSRALKRLSESQEDKAAKKQKLDEEAIPLALKVPVIDYKIYTKNNKPYYKIKRADETHQLYLSFLTRCLISNLDESKKCSWYSKGQKLEAVRVPWCANYNIHYNTVDLAGKEKISTYKVHSGTNA
uniref:Reverse transcriptase domain-containing protein n=1 Tax=Tanacetum cinerariifolium TaxID=118510 RepID=A0A699HAI6_TANCI|nr:hypothetical protein [Tanacetum cinerariifolium]